MGRKLDIRIPVLVCVLLGLAVAAAIRLSGQTTSPEPRRFLAEGGAHETGVQSESSFQLPIASALLAESEPVAPPPPTRSSFMATWKRVGGAKGYLLDVSTSSGFDNYVNGYHDLDVGDATGRVVTGLNQGTTYYYRVRAYDVRSMAGYTQTMAVATVPTTGLTIQATFDSSITGQPNAAVIEAAINQAISIYESLFTDPITIPIRFRYATTLPDGTPMTDLVESLTVIYSVGSNIWFNALRADAKSSNDSVAIAGLPDITLFPTTIASSANGRALGQNTPPAMNADGTVSVGGPYDGIVTLNSATSFKFTRPTDANKFDAQRSIQHGIDSILGILYSFGDVMPNDLFSWSAPGQRNTETTGTRYLSIDGGVTNIVSLNQDPNGSFGDWQSDACPQAHPYVQNAFPCAGQFSDVSATSPEGIDLDVIGYDLAQTGPPNLGNISTRSFVQTGEHVMIGGFIVQGSGPKRVIIRAIGPELTQSGINDALANPRLELHNATGAPIASNNDWQTTIIGGIINSNQVSAIQNSGHAPTAASESAIIADLLPGNYTATVSGVNNTNGVALVEVYDLSPAASSSLGNISTRSFVQTGENVMIGGFIVQGTGAQRVIIRAIGPELTQYGIPD